ncbi:MAG TPA: NUDIX domain-containing protein [Acidimicrobiia bacterium]|nr:NUDIX domain-containing protein [Acidimicrobiia bacterium]
MARGSNKRGYAIIAKKGRVLLVRNGSGRWLFPGGRTKPGESARDATRREVHEETGLRVELGSRVSRTHVRVHAGDCDGCVVYEAAKVKGTPKPHREIDKIAWVDIADVPARISDAFRTKRVEKILRRYS